jgi:hypothetical protein
MRLTGNLNASAVTREQQAMIAASDRRSFDESAGERQMAMTAAILESGYLAVGPEQHNRMA